MSQIQTIVHQHCR